MSKGTQGLEGKHKESSLSEHWVPSTWVIITADIIEHLLGTVFQCYMKDLI